MAMAPYCYDLVTSRGELPVLLSISEQASYEQCSDEIPANHVVTLPLSSECFCVFSASDPS